MKPQTNTMDKLAVQSTSEQPAPTPPSSTVSTRTSALSPRSPRNSRVSFAPQQVSPKQRQQQLQQQQEHAPKQVRLSQQLQPPQQSLQQPRASSPAGGMAVSSDASKHVCLPRQSSPVDGCSKGVRASRHSIAIAPRPHAEALAMPLPCAGSPRCGPRLLQASSQARGISPPRAVSP